MKLCKRSIITSSLLAILAISSAYGATPVQPTKSTDSTVIEMDYSNLPELKKIYRERNTSYGTIYA